MKDPKAPRKIWTYAYEIVPAESQHRLQSINALLAHERSDAERSQRTWAGRMVLENQVTHILVVSDSPAQDRDINRRLEAALKTLSVGFSVTVPMAVAEDAVPPTEETNGYAGEV